MCYHINMSQPNPNIVANKNRLPLKHKTLTVPLFAILASCATSAEVDNSPITEDQQGFIDRSGATTAHTGKFAYVGQLPKAMLPEYEELPVYDQKDALGDDINNGLAFAPRRFKTDFREGDGSGADVVCERLRVPAGTRYVQSTSDSIQPAWVVFDSASEIALLCYNSSGNPETVAVWAGNLDK